MSLHCIKLESAVIFINYIANVISLLFSTKIFNSKLNGATCIKLHESSRAGGK